mgnify:FL=1|tara:strand:+ start:356 stop:760 length:405 start_codon:yes stop_codon:yes gene_type:complete
MKFSGLSATPFLAVCMSGLSAWADGPHGSVMNFQLDPEESRTIFASGRNAGASFPVFKICAASSAGHGVIVSILETGKGSANAVTEPLSLGDCLFATGGKIVVTTNTDPSPESAAAQKEAAPKAVFIHVTLLSN